jgi:hypothetical protein
MVLVKVPTFTAAGGFSCSTSGFYGAIRESSVFGCTYSFSFDFRVIIDCNDYHAKFGCKEQK